MLSIQEKLTELSESKTLENIQNTYGNDFLTRLFQSSQKIIWDKNYINYYHINRYRRGLESCPQKETLFFYYFFRRFRATSMTQRRVENTRVHFRTFSVSVKIF